MRTTHDRDHQHQLECTESDAPAPEGNCTTNAVITAPIVRIGNQDAVSLSGTPPAGLIQPEANSLVPARSSTENDEIEAEIPARSMS